MPRGAGAVDAGVIEKAPAVQYDWTRSCSVFRR
jgi:hypothetical protein